MYKVFVNDTPIILSTKKDFGENYQSFPIKTVQLKKVIKKVAKGKLTHVNLYHEKESKLLKFLFKKLKVVTAGGGLVLNPDKDILFIYRNGRWDLPKGKINKFESIEACAIREVAEETGIEGLEISRFLDKTYHVFKRKGKLRLKVTHWFEMYSEFDGELVPETSEGIKKVKWKNSKKAHKALQKSYANIKELFPEKFLAGETENWVA